MTQQDLSWAIPLMRAGYAGRGLVYLVVAGFSLLCDLVRRAGQGHRHRRSAQLERQLGASVVLFLIFLGMVAFAALARARRTARS